MGKTDAFNTISARKLDKSVNFLLVFRTDF